MQRSSHGEALASYLLQQQSMNCRYFGALTYTVVLQHLDQPSNRSLLELVLSIGSHIRRLTHEGNSSSSNILILRKLISNLSQVFINYHDKTPNPLFTVLEAISDTDFQDATSFAYCITQLTPDRFSLILLVFAILIEDVTRRNDYKLPVHHAIRSQIYPMLLTSVEYIEHLHTQGEMLYGLDLETLKTIFSWMAYIPNIGGDLRFSAEDIAPLTRYLIIHLQGPYSLDNETNLQQYKEALLIFSEILESNAALLSLETKLILYSQIFDENKWGSEFLKKVVLSEKREEFEDEVNAFVYLVIVIAQLNLIRLSRSILTPQTQNILSIMYQITTIPGSPLIDEMISQQMLVFWEEFADVYVDLEDLVEILMENNNDPGFADSFKRERDRIFDEVARVYWKKIQITDLQSYQSSKSDLLTYRNNVADFFLVVYNLLKSPFYRSLAAFTAEKAGSTDFSNKNLAEIESTLFLLYKINEDSSYYELQTRELIPYSKAIFDGGIMRFFEHLILIPDIGILYMSTALHFISSNEFYFASEEGFGHLGGVFDYLFTVIMKGSKPLSLLASKAVTNVCEHCGSKLTSYLSNLEPVVIEMLKNTNIDSLVRLRMFNAFSVIARGIGSVEEHAEIIKGLITTIVEAARSMIDNTKDELREEQEDYLVSLISCIVNIAKGSGLPDETVDEMSEEEQERYRSFWASDPLQTKKLVLLIIEELCLNYDPLAQKPIVVEKATHVFKAGLGERLDGPFTLDNTTVAQFALRMMNSLTNPNSVPYVFNLVEALVKFNFRTLEPGLVLELVNGLIAERLDFLSTDPDMVKCAIDLSARIIECKPSLIIHADAFVNIIIPFALDGLSANETFIVKSVLKFWTDFTALRKGSKEDQEKMNDIFIRHNLGQVLTRRLIEAFLKSPRSALELYYITFRALLGKFPTHFKQWLINSLENQETSIEARVSGKDLEMFIHRLLVTRGRRAANEVLKSFWLQVNGVVDYGSQSF